VSSARIEIMPSVFIRLMLCSIVAKNVRAWRIFLTNRRNIVAAGNAAIAIAALPIGRYQKPPLLGDTSPEPPNSAQKSFRFGRPFPEKRSS